MASCSNSCSDEGYNIVAETSAFLIKILSVEIEDTTSTMYMQVSVLAIMFVI